MATYTGLKNILTEFRKRLLEEITGTSVYKMLFPDGEKVKVDSTGTDYDPTQIRAIKRVRNGTLEANTDYGYITVEVSPNGEETSYSPYVQVESTDTFSESKTYYTTIKPFLLKISNSKVVGAKENVAALFYIK